MGNEERQRQRKRKREVNNIKIMTVKKRWSKVCILQRVRA